MEISHGKWTQGRLLRRQKGNIQIAGFLILDVKASTDSPNDNSSLLLQLHFNVHIAVSAGTV